MEGAGPDLRMPTYKKQLCWGGLVKGVRRRLRRERKGHVVLPADLCSWLAGATQS